jgi:hypothetical protein
MLFSWLATLKIIGLSRIVGDLTGVSGVISLLQETVRETVVSGIIGELCQQDCQELSDISLQASDLCFTLFCSYFIIFRLCIHLYNNLFILILFLYSQFAY